MPSKKKVDKALDYATKEVCRLLDLFGERRFSFTVVYDDDLTEDIATVVTNRTLSRFRLVIGPGFLKESDEDRANTILHEVLHVLQIGWWHLVRFSLLSSSMPEAERQLFVSIFEDQLELYTDRMAGVLAGRI